ncbi:MAG TPA: SRPBCC family protein [Novimethylophilus sp.]|jgi:hypothetical protein|uniref:SRPBCC family protein n=1 Tax=Novimethylophilus sp. TaxID=2137426 RepID=UPI002F40BECB
MGCYNSVVIDAPADQVWAKVRNFHDLSWAAGVIEQCVAVGNIPATQIGAKRVLNNAFHETLHALDDLARVVRYSIDDGPGAASKDNVQGYVGEVRVFTVTENNGSFVVWASSWDSSGGGVAEFCNPIYRALLAALKKSFA